MENQGDHTNVIVRDLSSHPRCKHGPMLLFRQSFDSQRTPRIFYACSAFRDSKLKCSISTNRNVAEKSSSLSVPRRNSFLQKIMDIEWNQRGYCHSCNKLLLPELIQAHRQHHVTIGIDDTLIMRPTTLLSAISNDKREAQYFFDESTLKCICDLFKHNKLNKIICIGAPRLHEHLKFNFQNMKIQSLLLDLDERYRTFYSGNDFLLYNMFNNYFFDGQQSEQVFDKFLGQTSDQRICLFTDPPFGCRTEPLVYTIKQISKKYQEINKFQLILPVMWIFPYFMETYIRNEMPEMEMLDLKINYTNHKLYNDGARGRKDGSPIRIFTNMLLQSLILPQSDYKFCKKCEKWSAKDNIHCHKCNVCPSKSGAKYIHCNSCAQCVKPNYKHCDRCNRCTQVTGHNCTEYQKHIRCWICLAKGHNEQNCTAWFNLDKKLRLQRSKCANKHLKGCAKLCWICGKTGHNERICEKRKILLKEHTFLNCVENIFSN